jgi:hypothetical protein
MEKQESVKLSEDKRNASQIEKINEDIIPLDEGKKIRVSQFNSVPNNLLTSVNGGITVKEGVEFTFKKQEIEANVDTSMIKQENEVVIAENPEITPFEEIEDEIAVVSEEFKDSEKSLECDNSSVVSSFIGSRLNKTLNKKPTSGTGTGTENSFISYSDNKSVALDTQNLITETFLQKMTSRTLIEDEYDITNENSEGYGKFIETPKTGNIHLINNPFPRSKNSSLSVI